MGNMGKRTKVQEASNHKDSMIGLYGKWPLLGQDPHRKPTNPSQSMH